MSNQLHADATRDATIASVIPPHAIGSNQVPIRGVDQQLGNYTIQAAIVVPNAPVIPHGANRANPAPGRGRGRGRGGARGRGSGRRLEPIRIPSASEVSNSQETYQLQLDVVEEEEQEAEMASVSLLEDANIAGFTMLSNREPLILLDHPSCRKSMADEMKSGLKNIVAQMALNANGITSKELLFKHLFLDQIMEAHFITYTSQELQRQGHDVLTRCELYQVLAAYCFSCYFGMSLADLYDPASMIAYRPKLKKQRLNAILRNFRAWPRPNGQQETYAALEGVNIDATDVFKVHQKYGTNYLEFETALNQRLKKFYDSQGWIVIDDDHVDCKSTQLEDEQLFSHYNPDKAYGPVMDVSADQKNGGMITRIHLRGLKQSPTASMIEMLSGLTDEGIGGELMAFFNADREFTSLPAVNYAVACGAQTCSTVRRESSFTITKYLPFWFASYSGQVAPNPGGMTIPKSGAFCVYKAIRNADGVEADIAKLHAADDLSAAKRNLVGERLKQLVHLGVREGHSDKVVIMWGRSVRYNVATTIVYDLVDAEHPVAVAAHPLSENVKYLSRGQASADWFVSRKFRITGRSAKALQHFDYLDPNTSCTSIVEAVLKASFMPPVRAERVVAFELGSAAEPVVRRNLSAFISRHSSSLSVDVCQSEVGLACRKNFEHCSASTDGLFHGTMSNVPISGFIEIKSAVKDTTSIQTAYDIATEYGEFITCEYGSLLFNKVVDPDWKAQLLQTATTFDSRYGLLARGSKTGEIIYCVLISFPKRLTDNNLERLTMLFKFAFDWLYEEVELDESHQTGLVVRDSILWDRIPSPLDVPAHCRDRHTLEFQLSMWLAIQKEIDATKQPFARATNFRSITQFQWNQQKGGVDIWSRLIRNAKQNLTELGVPGMIALRAMSAGITNCTKAANVIKNQRNINACDSVEKIRRIINGKDTSKKMFRDFGTFFEIEAERIRLEDERRSSAQELRESAESSILKDALEEIGGDSNAKNIWDYINIPKKYRLEFFKGAIGTFVRLTTTKSHEQESCTLSSCVYCKGKTTLRCKDCGMPLCEKRGSRQSCFRSWHTNEILDDRSPQKRGGYGSPEVRRLAHRRGTSQSELQNQGAPANERVEVSNSQRVLFPDGSNPDRRNDESQETRPDASPETSNNIGNNIGTETRAETPTEPRRSVRRQSSPPGPRRSKRKRTIKK